jgi:hypothetical protein
VRRGQRSERTVRQGAQEMEVAKERHAARRRRQLPRRSIAAAARRSGLTKEVQERYGEGKEEERECNQGHGRRGKRAFWRRTRDALVSATAI